MARYLVCGFLVTVVGQALAITIEQKSHIQSKFIEVGAQCLTEHPLTVDDIALLKEKKLPEAENTGCFMACIFKNVGLIDDEGKLSAVGASEQHAKDLFSEEDIKQFEEFINTCNKVNDEEVKDGKQGCERAKLAFTCLNDQSSKFGFHIEF